MKAKDYIIIIALILILTRNKTGQITPTGNYVTRAEFDAVKKEVGYLREEFNNQYFA